MLWDRPVTVVAPATGQTTHGGALATTRFTDYYQPTEEEQARSLRKGSEDETLIPPGR
jgi:hypothetical protein